MIFVFVGFAQKYFFKYDFFIIQETGCRREDITGSLSGSFTGLSTKPCLHRELVAKLRSMTETIKMLSTENVSIREENDNLLTMREEEISMRGKFLIIKTLQKHINTIYVC